MNKTPHVLVNSYAEKKEIANKLLGSFIGDMEQGCFFYFCRYFAL